MSYSFEYVNWEHAGKVIRGSVYRAKDASGPWVICAHGFTNNRMGPEYLFVSLAKHLAACGVQVLTFDFYGCGESGGTFPDMTFSSMCQDLVSAVDFVKKQYTPSSIVLLGHSFGGTVVVSSIERVAPEGVILLSPLADIAKHINAHTDVLAKGTNSDGFFEFGPHEMSIVFLHDLKNHNPVGGLTKEHCKKLLLFQGDADEAIPVEESIAFVNKAREEQIPCDYHVIEQADHRYSTVSSRKEVQQTSLRWIKEILQ